ncbi:MAG: insulinase family protein [Lactobacillaceae bacterium]|jgi:predicted Zn-dependent peptidase|nr:insulinase family protein [Lactobacillaceae bacterium]
MNQFMPAIKHIHLANGLRVHLLPRLEFHQLVAMVTVDFGARDLTYQFNGQTISSPAGLAHFLEHKMFAQPGYDAFTKLSETGSDANAFTTQTRTSYFVTSPAYDYAGLSELLNFTQTPYFEAASVKREASIIQQEIDMYQDDANARLYRLLLETLYQDDPLSYDIAGTTTSVAAITSGDLQQAFDAFYQPANLDVILVGAFDATAVETLIAQSIMGQRPALQPVERLVPQLAPLQTTRKEVELNTVRNKVAMGQRYFEQTALPTGRNALQQAMAISLAIDLVFSESSTDYMLWYDTGLIDDNFSAEFDWERGAAFLSIAAETAEPEVLIDKVTAKLVNLAAEFDQLDQHFELVKKDSLGRLINKLNNLEEIATRFEGASFGFTTINDEIAILQSLTKQDVSLILAQSHPSAVVSVIARPKS